MDTIFCEWRDEEADHERLICVCLVVLDRKFENGNMLRDGTHEWLGRDVTPPPDFPVTNFTISDRRIQIVAGSSPAFSKKISLHAWIKN